jgi:hypothetical protein
VRVRRRRRRQACVSPSQDSGRGERRAILSAGLRPRVIIGLRVVLEQGLRGWEHAAELVASVWEALVRPEVGRRLEGQLEERVDVWLCLWHGEAAVLVATDWTLARGVSDRHPLGARTHRSELHATMASRGRTRQSCATNAGVGAVQQ